MIDKIKDFLAAYSSAESLMSDDEKMLAEGIFEEAMKKIQRVVIDASIREMVKIRDGL
jgi:hypothetical protein